MIGSQIAKGRNPLTISLSGDGMDWSKVWSVRAGPFTPGAVKTNDYAYPGAVWRNGQMIVIYSVDKVEIAVSTFDLAELAKAQ
jgi:hypothetical protein